MLTLMPQPTKSTSHLDYPDYHLAGTKHYATQPLVHKFILV